MSGPAVVIGNFDGVHAGHGELLGVAAAQRPGADLVAVTFWPHPLQVLRPQAAPPLLCTLRERLALLRSAGADRTEVVKFTPEVASWSPEEFVARIITPLEPDVVVVGANFTFGQFAAGDVDTLRQIAAGRFAVVEAPLFSAEGDRVTSSTKVRNALEGGDVVAAAAMLRRPFRVSGIVVRGAQRGREMGFPTANLPAVNGLAVPADGIYAGWLTRLNDPSRTALPAAISVGTNPTFDGVERTVEAYVLDRTDLELYDVEIAVDFVAHIRGQVRYHGMEALIEQMHVDVDQIREILGV